MSISLEYAAGFIDGDGSIVPATNRVFVYATGTDVETLRQFECFGGHVRENRDTRNAQWKPMWTWSKYIGYRQADFLIALSGLLILKKSQAELGAQLAVRQSAGVHLGTTRLPQEERAARLQLTDEIRRLNALSCTCPHSTDAPSIQYMAGFFDAEGCIAIGRYKKTAVRIYVNVTNRCPEICELFKEMFGGSVCRANGNCWQWQCSSRIAQRFLIAIQSHLVLKQTRALNALKLYDVITGRSFKTWSPQRLAATAAIQSEQYRLNAKGVGVSHLR